MNSMRYKEQNSHYMDIKGVNVYVDHINQRLRILDYQTISQDILKKLINISKEEGLGKIISNCRIKLLKQFRSCDFSIEGLINGFFGGEDAYCVSYFIDPGRQAELKREEEDSILYRCFNEPKRLVKQEKRTYTIRQASVNDIPQMISLFSSVFKTYPSPVFNMEYLEKVMSEHVIYKVAEENGKIISVASADTDRINLNAEITDCATYPEYRGKGILKSLIRCLEAELKEQGFLTAYSLSRAINPGINKALYGMGYKYSGRLINNCHICGRFEDMNIWIKRLGN